MSLLVLIAIHGLAFGRSVYHNRLGFGGPPRLPNAKLAGGLSLILWTCVMIATAGIATLEPPLDKIHAWLVKRN